MAVWQEKSDETRVSCLILGDVDAGKSSLFGRLVNQQFPSPPIEHIERGSYRTDIFGENIKMEVWLYGHSRTSRENVLPYQSKHVMLLVYDITNATSLQRLRDWKNEAAAITRDTAKYIVLGNKSDLADLGHRQVAWLDGKEYANEIGASFLEISAKCNTNLHRVIGSLVVDAARQSEENSLSLRQGHRLVCERALQDHTLSRDVARIQLALVGAFGAGKTNFALNLMRPGFDKSSDSTVGVTFLHTCTVMDMNVGMATSSAGPGPLLREVMTNAVTVSAISQAASQLIIGERITPREVKATESIQQTLYGRVKKFLQGLFVAEADIVQTCPHGQVCPHSHAPQSSSPPTVMPRQIVEAQLLEEIEKELSVPQAEQIFVDILDCGGQLSFSVLQALCFNPRKTIFLLMYNSSISLTARLQEVFRYNDSHMPSLSVELLHSDYIALWLSTLSMAVEASHQLNSRQVSAQSPTVLVVGTHARQCDPQQIEESSKAIHLLLSSFRDSPLRIIGPYHIDNSCPTDDDMRLMREKIQQTIQFTADFQATPLQYLKVEWFIKYLTRLKHLPPCMTLKAFSEFVQNSVSVPQKDMPQLLDYLHDNCIVRSFHHRSSPSSAHIFLNTDWFLSQITKILSCSMMKVSANIPHVYRSDIVDCLKSQGILTTRLCQYLWQDLDQTVQHSLLKIMDEFGLQCPAADRSCYNIPDAAGDLFHVPACIQRKQAALTAMPEESVALPEVLLHFSKRFFPFAIYTRLVVLLLQLYKPRQPEIDLLRVRFCCHAKSNSYFAELTHLPQGIAVAMLCTNARMAAGNEKTFPSIASVASHLLQSIERLVLRLQAESWPGLSWCPAFKCPQHRGRSLSDSSWVPMPSLDVHEVSTLQSESFHSSVPGSFLADNCSPRHRSNAPLNFHCWFAPSATFSLTMADDRTAGAVEASKEQFSESGETTGKEPLASRQTMPPDPHQHGKLSPPTLSCLVAIASAIPDLWACTKLAVALDIGDDDVRKVQQSVFTDELVYTRVLCKWLEVKGEAATKAVLYDALLEIRRADLAARFREQLLG